MPWRNETTGNGKTLVLSITSVYRIMLWLVRCRHEPHVLMHGLNMVAPSHPENEAKFRMSQFLALSLTETAEPGRGMSDYLR